MDLKDYGVVVGYKTQEYTVAASVEKKVRRGRRCGCAGHRG